MSVLSKVQDLYQQSVEKGEDFDGLVKAYILSLVQDQNFLAQVPLLDNSKLEYYPNNTLVRYRGMVQDILNPEYFVSSYRNPDGVWRTTRYTDAVAEPIHESAETQLAERKPLYCVKVPGEPSWVLEPYQQVAQPITNDPNGLERPKRHRDDRLDKNDANNAQEMIVDGSVAEPDAAKMARVEGGAQQSNATDKGGADNGALSNCPAGIPIGQQDCMVYVYAESDVKLNEVYDVLGLVSHAPDLAASQFDASMEDVKFGFSEQEAAARPPTSQVPRLHALLVSSPASGVIFPSPLPVPLEGAQTAGVRNSIIELFSGVLGGDKMAAEYLLLTIISRCHSRCEGSPLGLLSLNLYDAQPVVKPGLGCAPSCGAPTPSDVAAALHVALQAVLPRSTCLDLNVDVLNSWSLIPHRDYTSNRLVSTPLQVPNGTLMLLDETKMKAGQVTEMGINNIQALQHVLTHHQLQYDFQYYSISMTAELPVVIMSNGRSILKDAVDLGLPVRACMEFGDVPWVRSSLAALPLPLLRGYIEATQRCEFALGQDIAKQVEADIVASRQKDPSLGADTFHQWLTLSRLLCVSYGERSLSEERWQQIKMMEHKRAERVRMM